MRNDQSRRRRSVMAHQFGQVPRAEIPRASFDRSHGLKTTMNAGYLVPIFVDEGLPGDTFSVNMTGFGRLATPLHPIMDNLFLTTFFFAVPTRLLWDNWEKFNGAQDNPGDSTDFLVPQMVAPAGGYTEGSLSDYFGLPTKIAGYSHSSLWHRAYNRIYNDWFRDENLQNSLVVDTGNGPDNPANYVLKRRGKRPDYFTMSLPWPQKGTAVQLPLGTVAPLIGNGGTITGHTTADPTIRQIYVDAKAGGGMNLLNYASANAQFIWDQSGLQADLSSATAATIAQIREAFQIQRLYERDARGGTRYIELLKAHFGVTSPDARLQRAEYLGGGESVISVSPVPQTSSTDVTSPQGNLAAFGTTAVSGHGFTKSFTEHMIIIGLASIRADLTYQQGLNRMFSRSTRWDYYWPALANIGEQAVLNKEIYLDGTANDDLVFGYQERYGEYRYKPSMITGQFRSNAATPLDTWHLSQEFGALPVLNGSFIEDNPPIDRIIAVPSEPHLLLDCYFKMRCARPMPLFGVPGLIDHF